MKKKKLRFLLAVLTSSLIWIMLLVYTVRPHGWMVGSYGAWVPIHPPPLEIIFFTVCAVVISGLLYWWYRHDRVKTFASTIDAEERQRLLDLLLDQQLHDAPGASSEKRKRLANDGEIMADADPADEFGDAERKVAAGQAR